MLRRRRRRLTVDDFHKLVDAGILTERDRVELIDGELIEMTPIGSRHAYCVDLLNRALVRQAPDEVLVRVQNPVQLGEHHEPEPDLMLLRNRSYAGAHPGAEDVLLLVEVSDTSVEYDRTVKVQLYARHEIPEVWVVDLAASRVEVYRDPDGEAYRQRGVVASGALAPGRVSGVKVLLDELWAE